MPPAGRLPLGSRVNPATPLNEPALVALKLNVLDIAAACADGMFVR